MAFRKGVNSEADYILTYEYGYIQYMVIANLYVTNSNLSYRWNAEPFRAGEHPPRGSVGMKPWGAY